MPYTPPLGDDIEFRFGAGGNYVAPAGDQIEFAFGDEPANVLRLNARWAVQGATLPVLLLDSSWSVEARATGLGVLDIRWATAASPGADLPLDAQWAVEVQPSADLLLDAQWACAVPDEATVPLDIRYGVDVGEGILRLDIAYRTNAPAPADLVLDAQWAIAGVPSAVLLLDSQWATEGTPASTAVLDVQWASLGVTEATAALDCSWETLSPMDATLILDASWRDLHYVEQECVIAWQDEIEAAVELRSDGTSELVQAVELDSTMLTEVAQAVTLSAAMGDVEQALELDSRILDTVAQACEIGSPMLTTVEQAVEIDSAIKDTDDVAAAVTVISPILADSQVIQATQQALVILGQSVALAGIDISIDEGQFAWTCQATLLDPRQYSLFSADDEFTVDLGGETYSFLVESKRMARSLGENGEPRIDASIAGISPTVRHATPRGKRITKTWETAVVASAVAAELFPGVDIDWRIIDWSIPAFRLAAQNEAPIEILARVVAAAGAMVETNPDGSLYVRYAYPAPVADYEVMTPDQSYTDVSDRFSVSEGFAAAELVNRLRILDVTPSAYQDVIEFEQDRLNPAEGRLRVYPSPWRETFELAHTSLPIVSIERLGVDTAEHTETVEVLRGEGSVQYPIDAVLSLEWLYTNLGGVSFEADQRTFKSTSTAATESLLRITYRTRFVDFRAVAFPGAEVQVLVREPELG